jgi:hypothetical protein
MYYWQITAGLQLMAGIIEILKTGDNQVSNPAKVAFNFEDNNDELIIFKN